MAEVQKSVVNLESKPIEVLLTDGGPDHNVRFGSVKISLASHFLSRELDMIAAVMTAPGGSWINPAEKIMSILNIGLYGVALSRAEMDPNTEREIRSCTTMAELRDKAKKTDGLEDALRGSIQPVTDVVTGRFRRLTLKGKPFKTLEPATADDINMLFQNMQQIQPELRQSDTTQKQLAKHQALQEFMSKHARERQYSFQLKKCHSAPINAALKDEARSLIRSSGSFPGVTDALFEATEDAHSCNALWMIVEQSRLDREKQLPIDELTRQVTDKSPCTICQTPKMNLQKFMKLAWIPDPQLHENSVEKAKYMAFSDLYGTNTEEVDRTHQKCDKDKDTKKLLVKEKSRRITSCSSCRKPRVIYSDKRLWTRVEMDVNMQLEDIFYTCGSKLFPDGHEHETRIVVRQNPTCESPVEFQYYSCRLFPNVCVWCGDSEVTVPTEDELSRKFVTVLRCCDSCKAKGRQPVTRGKKQTNK